ncbi:MAG: tRNA 5-methoxyuridine(34)/uridine 5-oxyacetic acid(34) synthase CmoB [Desulfobacterales bacterium]|nr:tRNA 5-methoxyuridine(34)/uridine 5-oxyacetic acid(34) synthase CmoB [Desulfobacterales bacterium]
MEDLLAQRHRLKLDHCCPELDRLVKKKRAFLDTTRGNFFRFQQVVARLPDVIPSEQVLDQDVVSIGSASDLSDSDSQLLNELLEQLCPWRKGPFEFFGIRVDSEWQSWMKWDRIKDHAGHLEGKRILDIGSSNGYYMFRMAAQNPLMVLGLEPQSSFYYQYLAARKYLNLDNLFCLPATYNDMPKINRYFDRIFCMGVLYHRRSPIRMLKEMCESMRPGGKLILENLVVDAKQNICLFPKDRYAKMRNVFFIPDLLVMESWLLRAGFKEIQCVDVSRTTFEEQRKTKWIHTETLIDFLDPKDPGKTIEGYPAPVRAVFTARAS